MEHRKTKVNRLEKEYTQSKFEALQNQLNPHFLFNSLSVLSNLVHIDKNT
ncbi:MAG: histidine kinase [Hydrotalea flava]|nr:MULTISPECIES: histidine kinase [Hydrotalea]MBY0348976.1 histidine kinase [Hydrotalea flava]